MPRATYGPIVRQRVKRLLQAILDFVNYELDGCENIDLKFDWRNKDSNFPMLVVKTKLRSLEKLTENDKYEGKLTKRQIRESLRRMKDFLKILTDNRIQERGSETWDFSLLLWSSDTSTNLNKFEQKWEDNRPIISKQPNSKAPKQPTKITTDNSFIKAIVFPRCDHHTTTEYLEHSLKTAQELNFYSISLNFLWTEEHFQTLKQRVLSGGLSMVRICLADFSSKQILLRFNHDLIVI